MALKDGEKAALEWAALIPGVLRVLAGLADSEDLRAAADVVARMPVGTIAEELAKHRHDRATIEAGTQVVDPGVAVTVAGDEQ